MDEWDVVMLEALRSPASGLNPWMGTPQITANVRNPGATRPIVKRTVQRRLAELAATGLVERYDWDIPDAPQSPSLDRKTAYYRIVDGARASRLSCQG